MIVDKNNDNKAPSPPPLPLGWTQIKRQPRPIKRPRNDDASCRRPGRRRSRQRLVWDEDEVSNAIAMKRSCWKGTAFFCWHQLNPSWFQGYFWPGVGVSSNGDSLTPTTRTTPSTTPRTTKQQPFRLLAVQEAVDSCMECQDGGFRQVTLTVHKPSASSSSQSKKSKGTQTMKSPMVFSEVEWTGGDMMRLESTTTTVSDKEDSKAVSSPLLSCETQRIWTGAAAVPYAQQLFPTLLTRLKIHCGSDDDDDDDDGGGNKAQKDHTSILELLPDLAILKCRMMIIEE